MVFKTEYVLRFVETGHNETICEFTFNTTAEVKNFERYEEMPSSRTYEPYEHIFFIRYNNYWDLKGGTIEIPDGYELLDIKYYNEKTGYGSQSNYTDIWLVNTDTVVVEPVFNSRTNTYDYSQPGSLLLEKDESEKKVK